MKKNMRRFFAAMLTVSLFLISCGGKFSKEAVTDTTADETVNESESVGEPETVYIHTGDPDNKVRAEAYLAALPDRDFDGASFIITSPDPYLFDPSEISYISKSISERNSAVEEKYNVTISAEKADLGTMREESEKSAASGMFYSHVLIMPQTSVPSFATDGLLMNLRSVPMLDMTSTYFNSSSVSAMSFGDATYGIAGAALPASTGLSALFYNKNVADAIGADDLYETAMNGLLTWDKVHECYTAAASLGYIGAVTDGTGAIDAIYISTGQKYISSAEGTTPQIAVADYSMNAAATEYRTMRAIAKQSGVAVSMAREAFRTGCVLFTTSKISELDSLNSNGVRLGMLPMPKSVSDGGDVASTPYYHLADGTSEVFTVVADVTDSVMVSLVLSGLNAASYGVVTEALSDYLHATVLPDSRSADIFELMAESAVYDMASSCAPNYTEIANGTTELVRYIVDTGDFSTYLTAADEANSFLARNFSALN